MLDVRRLIVCNFSRQIKSPLEANIDIFIPEDLSTSPLAKLLGREGGLTHIIVRSVHS